MLHVFQSLKKRGRNLFLCCCMALIAQTANAHVNLVSPLGGQTFQAGASQTIHWTTAIQHNIDNWDLWYSTTGSDGPWIDLAIDLPPGAVEAGSQHSFDWLVPNVATNDAWVRVRQDNGGTDYYSQSTSSFTIEAIELAAGDFNGDGQINADDFTAWQGSFGIAAGATLANGDADNDGDVDGDDFITWQANFSPVGNLNGAAVPEPATAVLAMLVVIGFILARRKTG